MVFVAHDTVESHFVGQGVLLVVLVVQHAGFLGVEVGVGESETPRLELLQVCVGNVPVRLLGEPVYLRLVFGSGQLLYHRPFLLTVL